MSHAPKPAPRTDALAVIFSTEEKDAFRSKCALVGVSCSSEARRILNAWTPLHPPSNGNAGRRQKERPRHTHVGISLPNRATRGGAPRPSRF
jgi:hypothetical protein